MALQKTEAAFSFIWVAIATKTRFKRIICHFHCQERPHHVAHHRHWLHFCYFNVFPCPAFYRQNADLSGILDDFAHRVYVLGGEDAAAQQTAATTRPSRQ